jgi:hypothetical protein
MLVCLLPKRILIRKHIHKEDDSDMRIRNKSVRINKEKKPCKY